MSDDSFDLDALGRLGSEQQALLDTVDSLRGQGIQRDSLPQIVVVGDKSSGKSSVLEAISRVPFPVKSGLCTRSPTELILRKTAERRIVVQVCDTNSTRDGGFNKECVTKQDLPAAIEEAKEVMGIGDGAQDFSKETLRIEVSDIDLPRLTLVDLPGLYRTATTDETSEGIKTVRGLTEQYMGQKNTIILAVLAASSDIALQEVLDLAKKYDPTGERTIGVITKPDLLVQFSADERAYLRLLRNEEPTHSLKLGWHTLRNRTSTENDENNCGESKASDTDRDDKERNFFDAGAWSHISYQDKGVDALREKLSRILTKHVQLSLPPLIGDMERKLKRHQNDLEKLGDERSSTSERRGYLLNIASQFRDIARAATNGSYEGGFFRERKLPESRPGQLLDHSHQRKLRATIRNLNCAFDAVIATKGARRAIHWGDNVLLMDKDRLAALPNPLKPWIALYGVSEPVVVTSTDLQRELEIQATHSRGNQFPGSSNDRLALELFRDQAQNWQSIASKHLELVVSAAKVFVLEALQYIVGNNQTSMDAIHREYVDTFFEQRQASLKSKLRELIHHYQEGSVICLEDEFQRRMAKHHATNLALRVRDHLPRNKAEETFPHVFSRDDVYKTVLNAPMEKLDNFGLDRVIEMMTAYYKMSLRTFTDNIMILAVENCLVSKIPDLLESIKAEEMDESKLKRLTDEPATSSRDRKHLSKEIAALKEGLRICEKHRSESNSLFSKVSVIVPTSELPGPKTNLNMSAQLGGMDKTDSSGSATGSATLSILSASSGQAAQSRSPTWKPLGSRSVASTGGSSPVTPFSKVPAQKPLFSWDSATPSTLSPWNTTNETAATKAKSGVFGELTGVGAFGQASSPNPASSPLPVVGGATASNGGSLFGAPSRPTANGGQFRGQSAVPFASHMPGAGHSPKPSQGAADSNVAELSSKASLELFGAKPPGASNGEPVTKVVRKS